MSVAFLGPYLAVDIAKFIMWLNVDWTSYISPTVGNIAAILTDEGVCVCDIWKLFIFTFKHDLGLSNVLCIFYVFTYQHLT